ncbi:hypothetical protein CDAR_228201 [Caerostris darwini]|uniref:Uncharacterized protein n=1 Tax=Caerostris darwini TaxID=1538125 RepID=A0AAV4N4J0_9ARAC|nr:hypothetical protein CDAR_228201 [Caerostris darwini]
MLISVLLRILPPDITLEFNLINTDSSDGNIETFLVIAQKGTGMPRKKSFNFSFNDSHSSQQNNWHHLPKQRSGVKLFSTAHGLLASTHAKGKVKTDLCLFATNHHIKRISVEAQKKDGKY